MSSRDSFLTTANLLSLARVPLAALFAWALGAAWGGSWAAVGVLGLAGLTDAFDGWFARRAAARRSGGAADATPAGMGSWLDPICDKIFVATVLAAIWMRARPPLSLVALILARELAQLPLSLVYALVPALRRWLRYDFRASVAGKAATVMQFAAVTSLLFDGGRVTWALAVVAFLVGVVALADYLWRAVRIGRGRLGA